MGNLIPKPKMESKFLFLLMILLVLPLAFASNNIFSLQEDKIVYGYCQYNNGSDCNSLVNCNLSVYYLNKTTISENLTGTYLGGTFTYNITSFNLSSGNYLGLQTCSLGYYRGYSVFEIEILPATVSQQMGGGSVYAYQSDLEELREEIDKPQEKDILEDAKSIIKKFGNLIYPNHILGILITILLIIIFIFGMEIRKYFKKRRIVPREETK